MGTQQQVKQLESTLVSHQKLAQQQRMQDAQNIEAHKQSLTAATSEVAKLRSQLEQERANDNSKSSNSSAPNETVSQSLGTSTSERHVEDMKRRIVTLEAELSKLLSTDESPSSDEEWV